MHSDRFNCLTMSALLFLSINCMVISKHLIPWNEDFPKSSRVASVRSVSKMRFFLAEILAAWYPRKHSQWNMALSSFESARGATRIPEIHPSRGPSSAFLL